MKKLSTLLLFILFFLITILKYSLNLYLIEPLIIFITILVIAHPQKLTKILLLIFIFGFIEDLFYPNIVNLVGFTSVLSAYIFYKLNTNISSNFLKILILVPLFITLKYLLTFIYLLFRGLVVFHLTEYLLTITTNLIINLIVFVRLILKTRFQFGTGKIRQ